MVDINRKIAYDILVDVEKNLAYSNIELNTKLTDGLNKPFIRELTYGVIKNKYLLDYIIDTFAKKVDIKDKILLRMGVYQLLYMYSVPNYAAISTTVDLAKKVRYGKDRFINGVLRNIDRKKDELNFPTEPYIKYSINKDIYDLISSQYGNVTTEEVLRSSNLTPKLSMRVNLKRISVDGLKDVLIDKGFNVSKSKLSNRSLIIEGKDILNTEEFKNGLFSVQDSSSTYAIDEFFRDYDGNKELLIDVCSAPGGKSLASLELLSKESKIVSCDIYDNKLKLIAESANRLGFSNLVTINHDATKIMDEYIEKADRVICDVPCSGFGVFKRKPEIKYKSIDNLPELIDIQYHILKESSKYLKDDGLLLYSTCTINKDENENQIKRFLEENSLFKLEKDIQLLQNDENDGFYIAILRKNASRI